MSSISMSALPALIGKEMYPVMLQTYQEESDIASAICNRIEVGPGWKGDRETVITDMGELEEVVSGQPSPATSMETAYVAHFRAREFSRRISIPISDFAANNATETIIPKLAKAAREWGPAGQRSKQRIVADVMQKGTLAAGHLATFNGSFEGSSDPYPLFIYDGKPFFAATGNGHPLAAGSGTYVNLVTSRALTAANVQTTLTTMKGENAVNDRGQRVVIRPNLLVVPPGLEYTAKVILNSTQVAGSNNNDINVLNGELMPVVFPYLDDSASSAAWWIGTAKKGIRLYDGGPPVIRFMEDPVNRCVHFVAEGVYGAGVEDWRYWFACNKAAS